MRAWIIWTGRRDCASSFLQSTRHSHAFENARSDEAIPPPCCFAQHATAGRLSCRTGREGQAFECDKAARTPGDRVISPLFRAVRKLNALRSAAGRHSKAGALDAGRRRGGIVHAPNCVYRHGIGFERTGMAQEWLWRSAADLGRGIAAGRINPVDLTETYLEAISAHPLRDRIYARVTPDRARSEAEAAARRAAAGRRRGPLDGVPVSWKDLFDTSGVATEAGTALLKGRVPAQDAEVLRNATSAGLICLGKTHMSELAFSGLGYNPVTATPPSVNDANAVAGGSSSGAAASVAHGLAACGIGSDTGGSVRVPAAWNDLVGLKTTSGRLPLNGVVPLVASLDTVGPLCRTVEDAALTLAALEGASAPDLAGASLRNARLLVPETITMDSVRSEPRAAFCGAVERLRAAGAIVEWREAPLIGEVMEHAAAVMAAEAYGTWRHMIEKAPEKMFPEILERFRAGSGVSGADFAHAWRQIKELRRKWLAFTAAFDAAIWPASPILPPNIERLASDSDYYKAENLLALRNTRIGNLLGLSSLTLPTGVPSAGILINMRPMAEERLLRLGKAAEEALA